MIRLEGSVGSPFGESQEEYMKTLVLVASLLALVAATTAQAGAARTTCASAKRSRNVIGGVLALAHLARTEIRQQDVQALNHAQDAQDKVRSLHPCLHRYVRTRTLLLRETESLADAALAHASASSTLSYFLADAAKYATCVKAAYAGRKDKCG